MNEPDSTILTDRGAAIVACIKKYYFLAFMKPCAIHIKRNLISHGFSSETLLKLYWKATNACTKDEYVKVMAEMSISGNGKGEQMKKYLEEIPNWQLYKAILNGNIIYGMTSDNLVEQVFSWLSEARSYVTPYYLLSYIVTENIARLSKIYEECLVQHELGLTTW